MKKLSTIALTLLLVCLLPLSAFAEGWVINEDTNTTKYQKADGEYAADEWQTIDGKQYYFRTTGEMAKGWVKTAVIGTTATKKPENGVMKIWPPT